MLHIFLNWIISYNKVCCKINLNVMRLFKILFFNICIIVCLLFMLEGVSYSIIYIKCKDCLTLHKNLPIGINEMSYKKIKKFSLENIDFRPVSYKKSNKRPVILFGCSFTYGSFLNDNQTFSYKLSNYTNRTVYNKGIGGAGVPLMYYFLKSTNIKKDIPDAEFIIYTFIGDHLCRLFKYRSWPLGTQSMIKYKIINDKLIEEKPFSTLFQSTYMSKLWEEDYANFLCDHKQYKKIFYALMDASMKEAKEKYPGVKFVFFVYGYNSDKELIDELKNRGFIVIYFSDLQIPARELSKDKYYGIDHAHPSEAAWDLIVPRLSKKLNM